MTKTVKNLIIRLVALLLFAAVIAATILYQGGAYDISFIERKKKPVESETASEDTEPTETTKKEEQTTRSKDTINPDKQYGYEDAVAFVASLEKLSDSKEYEVYSGKYDGSQKLLKLDFTSYQEKYSPNTVEKTINVIKMKSGGGSYMIEETTVNYEVPYYFPYFGYIVYNIESYYDIYTISGKKCVTKFTGTFTYDLSVNGNPTVKIGKTNYELTSSGLKKISAGEVLSSPYEFSYTSNYGPQNFGLIPYSEVVTTFKEITKKAKTTTAPPETSAEETSEGDVTSDDSTLTLADESFLAEGDEDSNVDTSIPEDTDSGEEYEETSEDDTAGLEFPTKVKDWQTVVVDGRTFRARVRTLWGYKDADGNVVLPPTYKQLYGFSENGIGSALTIEEEVVYFDLEFNVIINELAKPAVKLPEMLHIKCKQRYMAPVNDDIYSLGSYYFDNGYTMVRYIFTSTQTIDIIYGYENRLVNEKGKEFTLPTGYNLISYSDGILLVENDGMYGYYRIDETWLKPAVYEDAKPFIQGLAVVKTNGYYGVINTKGEFVIPPAYEQIFGVSDGLIVLYNGYGWDIICVADIPEPEVEETN